MKPRFLLSKSKVIEQYNKIKDLGIVSYSSKTNPLVTKILEENTNSMFSIHFVNELKHIKDKSRVLFLAQAWNEEEIKKLLDLGIKFFVVDNESDLDILLGYLEGKDIKINLFLRLKLKENTLRTERYFVFGMGSDVINKRVMELKDNPNLKLGVHFHRKTQNMAEWNLAYEMRYMLKEEVLDSIEYLNIGGGLPSEYANTNVKVIDVILNKIKELKEELKCKLIIEPGRFISAPAIKLETNIIGIHENNIIVNASVYNSDLDALVVPVKLLVEGEGKGEAYVIKGVTPCSMDLFRYKVYLENPKIGDKLVFLNAGAYNFTTNFCELDEIETEII
ncbi:decarboxylase [archaeon]|jgi:ornithine decarboxylase|nr:decarboxylase [archaeon]MBT4441528.1 decarboxylase [archaeon]